MIIDLKDLGEIKDTTNLLNSTTIGEGQEIEASFFSFRLKYKDRPAATWSKKGFVGKRMSVELAEFIIDPKELSIY